MPLSATDQQYTSMEPRRTHAGAWRTELVEEIDSFLEQQRREQQRRDEERRDEEIGETRRLYLSLGRDSAPLSSGCW